MPPVTELFADPRFHLHRVDPAEGRLVFVETQREILSAAAFIDGRTPLSAVGAKPISVPIEVALAAAPPPQGRERYILHMSFCGSTLLARMCDVPGKAFAAKEPQALVDLSDWAAALRNSGKADARLAPTLALVRGQLAKRWGLGEPVVVKPSNWVNSLLRELFPNPRLERIVIVEIGLRDFLTAVFRGGRDRIVFTLRCLTNLQSAFPEHAPLIAAASAPGGGDWAPAARLIAVFHYLQRLAFSPLAGAHRIQFPRLIESPEAALVRTAEHLDLPFDEREIDYSVRTLIRTNAKAPGMAFDPAVRAQENLAVDRAHHDTIEAAVAWAAAHLPTIAEAAPAPAAKPSIVNRFQLLA